MFLYPILTSLVICFLQILKILCKQPNIILIVADDLGWGDVGWNNPFMLDVTPSLTKLAKSGVILSQYYVQQVCTPSRAALMTGMYPFHIGRQKQTIKPLMPTGLTLNRTLLPEQLAKLGYRNHLVGKWHLGFCKWEYTPTFRGFHHFFGFYTGASGHFSHVRGNGYDFRKNTRTLVGVQGKYSTDLFTDETVNVIKKHKFKNKPLFITLCYQAPHAPLEVPKDAYNKIHKTGNFERDVFRAMVLRIDQGVEEIVKTLKKSGEWKNTLLVFTTDNGGAVSKGGNNHPLRGTKGTLFEGGTRAVGFVAGGHVKRSGVTNSELMHITDWYPTLLSAAGDGMLGMEVDGVDQWNVIRSGGFGKRKEVVYNLKLRPLQGAIRIEQYKLMFAQEFPKDIWFGSYKPKSKEFKKLNLQQNHKANTKYARIQNKTNIGRNIKLKKNRHFLKINKVFKYQKFKLIKPKASEICKRRNFSQLNLKYKTLHNCKYNDVFNVNRRDNENGDEAKHENFKAQEILQRKWPKLKKHLFNVVVDPEERIDLKRDKIHLVKRLYNRILEHALTMIEEDFPEFSEHGKPENFNNIWSPGWC